MDLLVFHRLIDIDLAGVLPLMSKVGSPEEIQPFSGFGIEVHPYFIGPGQRDGLLLNHMPCRIDQFKAIASRLRIIESECQAVCGGIGINLVTDEFSPAGAAIPVHDKHLRIADLSSGACFLDPKVEFVHISLIRVVLILVFCCSTCCIRVSFRRCELVETFSVS